MKSGAFLLGKVGSISTTWSMELIFSPRVTCVIIPRQTPISGSPTAKVFACAAILFDVRMLCTVDIAGGEQPSASPGKRVEGGALEERISGSVDYYHSFGAVQLNLMLEGF